MEKIRSLIYSVGKNNSKVKGLIDKFQSSEITEDELIYLTIDCLNQNLTEYINEENKLNMMSW